jgi:hypothetical protein
LVVHVIQAAHGRFDDLRLRTNNPAAARLYETLGFRSCDDAGDYTHIAKLTASPNSTVHRTGARDARSGR